MDFFLLSNNKLIYIFFHIFMASLLAEHRGVLSWLVSTSDVHKENLSRLSPQLLALVNHTLFRFVNLKVAENIFSKFSL